MKVSATESLHYTCIGEECSELLDQRKQAKLQWLQNPSQTNADNLNNVRCETSKTFRNKKKEYFKEKINKLETNIRNKSIRDLYRGISEFKKGYQPRTNLVKDENGDLLADSHNILNTWKNYFCQLLNVHGIKDVRQREMHTNEPLAPEPSSFYVEITIEKLKNINCKVVIKFQQK
jgi:hypothetical protein